MLFSLKCRCTLVDYNKQIVCQCQKNSCGGIQCPSLTIFYMMNSAVSHWSCVMTPHGIYFVVASISLTPGAQVWGILDFMYVEFEFSDLL